MSPQEPPRTGFAFGRNRALGGLSLLLCAVFLTGGSSWSGEPGLAWLRAWAAVSAIAGLWAIRTHHLQHYRWLWLLAAGAFALPLLQLVPLPYGWWSVLPGRAVIVAADAAMGLGPMARPMSMVPDATFNALTALLIPLSVLVLTVQLDERQQRIVLIVLLALAATSGILGIVQSLGIDAVLYDQSMAPAGLFANRNHGGVLLAMLIPMGVAALLLKRSPAPQWLNGLLTFSLVGLTLPLVLVAGSRSGLVLAIAGLLSTPWLVAATQIQEPKRRRRWLVMLTAGVLVALVVTALAMLSARDLTLSRMLRLDNDLRWPLWQSILDSLPAYWPWGSGLGSFAQAYQVVEPDSLLRPDFSNHAHNDWLELVFTGGLPAALLAAAAIGAVIKAVIAAQQAHGSQAVFARLGAIMVGLLMLGSLTDYPARTPILLAVLALASVWASAAQGFVHNSPLTAQGD